MDMAIYNDMEGIPLSALRRIYMGRFVFRCAALALMTVLLAACPGQFEVVQRGQFLKGPSLLHILWLIWVCDMLMQLIPLNKTLVSLGSQKLFRCHFRPAAEPSVPQMRRAMKEMDLRAAAVFVMWTAFTSVLGLLRHLKILSDNLLLWISVVFYVCDLICVLFWCPFRQLILKNRCCTTCRIFNWDHLMMFSPLIFLNSFYARSLVAMAAAVFLVWEITLRRHPERFLESTNLALRCGSCTDRLCSHGKKLQND